MMGWKLTDLENGWQLATHGGLRGIYVTDGETEVHIPKALLLKLAADHIVSNQIAALEQKSFTQVLIDAGLANDYNEGE